MSFNKWFITFFTEPKVCYLYKTICVEQQVVQFKIPQEEKRINNNNKPLGMEKNKNNKAYRYTILWSWRNCKPKTTQAE